MSEPIVIVAKHVPEKFRNEPRNVGVIICAGGSVMARFLGEDRRTGRLNLNQVPQSLVRDKQAYRSWVEYWRECLNDPDRYAPFGPGGIARATSRHMETLLSFHKDGQYFLTGGMSLIEDIAPANLAPALDNLFERLVVVREEPTHEEALKDCIASVISQKNLHSIEHFREKFAPEGSRFHYDYLILGADNRARRIWQRCSTYGRTIEKEVASTGFKLIKANADLGITPADAFTLIRCDPEQAQAQAAQLNVLREYSTVLNLELEEDRAHLFDEVPALAGV